MTRPRHSVAKDGRRWRIGTSQDVAWLRATTTGQTVNAAIPPMFEAYATFWEIDDDRVAAQERAVLSRLVEQTAADQSWWLGYLHTGAHDTVFPDAAMVTLYYDWRYVLVEAGPEQAATWRTGHMRSQYGILPDLMFPADRAWLVSALWDDTWTCVGGSRRLVSGLADDPLVRARPVHPDEDAMPPGHEQYR